MTPQTTQTVLIILTLFQFVTLLLVLLQFGPQNSRSAKISSSSKKRIVLDTSAIIDGRVLSLSEAGFLNDCQLISTNIVLDELQYLADQGDSFKRSRARYGLEILNKLSSLSQVSLTTKNLPKSELEVDQQLLNLAKSMDAQLFTADFNLAQRARIEGVNILSPNDLAEALKPQILPGESFKIKLIQKGDDRGQAVGYLPDGTMVVAENAQNKIGQTLELKSSKIIQTTAGRIVFAQASSSRSNSRSNSAQNPNARTKVQTQPEAKQMSSTQASSPQPQRPTRTPRQQQNRRPKATKEDSLIEAINKSA